jgi:hypothetical protein
MKTAVIALVAVLGLATAAEAAERMSDMAYVKASRCKGIAVGVGQDTAALDSLLKEQGRTRESYIRQRAENEMHRARREARSEDRRARLNAELTGACAAFGSTGAATGAAAG